MTTAGHIAKHLRDVYFGGNWTCVNYKDTLADVNWEEATTKVYTFNTIATLLNHVSYYVALVHKVLQGGPLDGKDELSFAHEPVTSQEEWEAMQDRVFSNVTSFATLVEKVPETQLWEDFTDKKYGNYYRNLQGIVEHLHYHLGQIVLIKKIIREGGKV